MSAFRIFRKQHLRLAVVGSFLLATLLSGCKEKPAPWTEHTFSEQDFPNSDGQILLPHSLWEKVIAVLEADHSEPAPAKEGAHAAAPAEHGGGHDEGKGGEAAGKHQEPKNPLERAGTLPSVFAPLKVYLIEKNRGLLLHGHTAITFAAGGGALDLHQFIREKNGSFYLVPEFMPDVPDSAKKVYFLSNAKQRKIDGETFGAGCHAYYDISGAVQKALKTDGILLNTTDGRAVSALAGTYFFAATRAGKLYLAALRVSDSAHPAWLCQHAAL